MAGEWLLADEKQPVYNFHHAMYPIDSSIQTSPQSAGVSIEYSTPSSAHASHPSWDSESGYVPPVQVETDGHNGHQWLPYWNTAVSGPPSTPASASVSVQSSLPHTPNSWPEPTPGIGVVSPTLDHVQTLQPAPPLSAVPSGSTNSTMVPLSPAITAIQRKRINSIDSSMSNSDHYSDGSDVPPATSSVSEDASPAAASRPQPLTLVPRPIRPRRDDSDIPLNYGDDRAVARYRHKKSQAESSLRRRQAMQEIDKILRQSGVDVHGAPRQLRAFLDLYNDLAAENRQLKNRLESHGIPY